MKFADGENQDKFLSRKGNEMKEKIILFGSLSIIAFILFSFLVVFLHEREKQRFQEEIRKEALYISQADVDFINQNLKKRNANDCCLERTEYGYKCKELVSKKLFKIKM